MNKTDVSLASQFCSDCHLRYNCDNITEYICLSNDFCKYIKDFRPARDKKTMELVWHNCKTCPPEEAHNECLYITNGDGVFEIVWDNGYWLDYDGRMAGNANEHSEEFWWADIDQTTAGFFKSVGLFKPTFL